MNLFVTQEFKASFTQQPQIGDWVIRKFYEWKCSGSNTPIIFGRDEADTRPNFQNLIHAHVIPTRPEALAVWMEKALRGVDAYYMTSNRFVLYAKHESTPSYLLIDHYIDQDPKHTRTPHEILWRGTRPIHMGNEAPRELCHLCPAT